MPPQTSGGLGLDRHIKMPGQWNLADQQEMPFLPHLVQFVARTCVPRSAALPDQAAPKALREEKGRAPRGAVGDEWEFTGTVNAVVEGHGGGEYTLDGAGPEETVPSGSQTPNVGCLMMRQPAWSSTNFKWC